MPRLLTTRLMGRRLLACLLLFGMALLQLKGQSDSGTGIVTGQVFCSDNQKPARFATVNLSPAFNADSSNSYRGRRSFGTSASTTGADGTFIIKDVPVGMYDLQVSLPGYIQPLRQLNLYVDNDPAAQAPWLAMLTRITVQAGQTITAVATAYRGADLTGIVLYDDGSPASGVSVITLLAINPNGTASSTKASSATTIRPFGVVSVTDDRGRFYLSGLAQGTYTVEAAPRGGSLFPVYLGNTIDRTQSELVSVQPGDVRSDLELQINISNLHHVRGVLVGSDNHPLPDTSVNLSIASSGTDSIRTSTAADGSFAFSNVPDGKFTVTAGAVSDPETHVTYKGSSTQVNVSGADVTDVVLNPTS